MNVKRPKVIAKPRYTPENCTLSMKKAFFMQIFVQKQTFKKDFSLLEALPSPFES